MSKRVLLVEDEHDVIRLLKYNLEREGFVVNYTTEGSLALAEVRHSTPDVILLDLMLPGMDGLEVCRQIRRNDQYSSIPIIMLTAKSSETDRVIGLELSADDYITKPFSMRELVARIRALLRRRERGPEPTRLQRGQLIIDPAAHAVMVGDRRVELSALEFRLLYCLAAHPRIVFSRDQLLDRVWGNDRAVTARSVDVYIRRIREKIEPETTHPVYIETVHGVGYRFGLDTE